MRKEMNPSDIRSNLARVTGVDFGHTGVSPTHHFPACSLSHLVATYPLYHPSAFKRGIKKAYFHLCKSFLLFGIRNYDSRIGLVDVGCQVLSKHVASASNAPESFYTRIYHHGELLEDREDW